MNILIASRTIASGLTHKLQLTDIELSILLASQKVLQLSLILMVKAMLMFVDAEICDPVYVQLSPLPRREEELLNIVSRALLQKLFHQHYFCCVVFLDEHRVRRNFVSFLKRSHSSISYFYNLEIGSTLKTIYFVSVSFHIGLHSSIFIWPWISRILFSLCQNGSK